ncbi:TetR/AcrR family transcriptional regulator [Catenulispora rubra]|uniref:TetR/AcrR family transcriptional regulator n=1 Tax=Catenulispora rubra TaxID=280293 RepID=UPI00189256C8|nr:TetR/AcrR family transcriptional regulator [Catenulispora rubra]
MNGTADPAGAAGGSAGSAGTADAAAGSSTDSEAGSTTDSGADPASDAPQRGRPRSHRAHQAILAAASDLLLTRGLSAVSMDTVAERAGVSKATIYRWWPTKESLALDALFTEWSAVQPTVRDTGSLRSDLVSLIRPWARLVASRPYGPVIAQLIAAAQADPVFAVEYRQRFVEPRRELARAALQRAVERGEIPAGTRMEVALDLIYGPIYHRLLHGHGPVNDRFVKEAIDMALDGIRGGGGR